MQSGYGQGSTPYFLKQKKRQLYYNQKGDVQFDPNIFQKLDNAKMSRRSVFWPEDEQKDRKNFKKKDTVFYDTQFELREREEVVNLHNRKSRDSRQHEEERVTLRRLFPMISRQKHDEDLFSDIRKKDGQYEVENSKPLQLNNKNYPHCILEMQLLPETHFKQFFLQKTVQQNGRYELIVNQEGRYEVEDVDDVIPIYEKTGQPIWGLSLEKPWQIILLKAFAKKMGSYNRVLQAKPFQFIQAFSSSNWRYYNLTAKNLTIKGREIEEATTFALKYQNIDLARSFILLKSKKSKEVERMGLIKNKYCYRLMDVINNGQKQSEIRQSKQGGRAVDMSCYEFLIRSPVPIQWNGHRNIQDENFEKSYSRIRDKSRKISLEKDFLITYQDFKNLFSSAYVTSNHYENEYENYERIVIPANFDQSFHLVFKIDKPGFLDFSLTLSDKNQVQAGKKSRIYLQQKREDDSSSSDEERNEQQNRAVKRYTKVKYILAKDSRHGDQCQREIEMSRDYHRTDYYCYEIDYLRGAEKSSGYFIRVVEGKYILRINQQRLPNDNYITLQYSSNDDIKVKPEIISPEETGRILRDSMVTRMDTFPRRSLDPKKPQDGYEEISMSESFDDIGYGCLAIRSKKNCPYDIVVEIDPRQINSSGYTLKGRFKNTQQKFGFLISRGEGTALMLERREDVSSYNWPPKGIGIFKTKNLSPAELNARKPYGRNDDNNRKEKMSSSDRPKSRSSSDKKQKSRSSSDKNKYQ